MHVQALYRTFISATWQSWIRHLRWSPPLPLWGLTICQRSWTICGAEYHQNRLRKLPIGLINEDAVCSRQLGSRNGRCAIQIVIPVNNRNFGRTTGSRMLRIVGDKFVLAFSIRPVLDLALHLTPVFGSRDFQQWRKLDISHKLPEIHEKIHRKTVTKPVSGLKNLSWPSMPPKKWVLISRNFGPINRSEIYNPPWTQSARWRSRDLQQFNKIEKQHQLFERGEKLHLYTNWKPGWDFQNLPWSLTYNAIWRNL